MKFLADMEHKVWILVEIFNVHGIMIKIGIAEGCGRR